MKHNVPVGVLLSGGGTNLQAIIDAIEQDGLDAEIRTVVSNRESAYGLIRARNHRIPTTVIDHRGHPSRDAYDQVVVEHLKSQGVELVVLAGFMRLLSPYFVQSFPNRIMNIHPALSPAFGGLHGQRQAIEYGVRFAGCTVHFVSEGCDEGPIIIQAVVPVLPDDTEETLAQRILAQEHRIYPRAIQLYSEGRLVIEGRKVRVTGEDGDAGGGSALVNPRILENLSPPR
ncbi:MAG: phosphoribosylglycinamide formyltransferase [Deltaproteobacteria bacterium]|nr:phosphoribosylglycinamide formyltransferase [Deltaproteobacteria bacterium]